MYYVSSGIECTSINTTNHHDWVVCAGILESLVNRFQERSILLTKIKNESSPNPISFLVETSHIITSIKIESKQYLLTTEQVLSSLIANETVESGNILDSFPEHDPGKREIVKSSAQRKYLLSLGLYQPKLAKYPKNLNIPTEKQSQFTSLWFNEFPHLEYSIQKDAAFCFICSLFPNGPNRNFADPAWVVSGVRNWHQMKGRGKNKQGKLALHFSSKSHNSALIDFRNFLTSSNHIDCILNKVNRQQAIEVEHKIHFHKEVITILLDITRTLARQGLAFRGDMNEENGNFNQLVLLISRHNPTMKRWLDDKKFRKHNVTYLSHDSQNEFIDLLADETKNTIIEEVKKSDFFSLMADTTPDVSHQDQLSICLRYLDPF